jgi:hypothetical protein
MMRRGCTSGSVLGVPGGKTCDYANYADPSALTRIPNDCCSFAPLFHWATRAWLRAHRGEMHDDPVVDVAQTRDDVARRLVPVSGAVRMTPAATLSGGDVCRLCLA